MLILGIAAIERYRISKQNIDNLQVQKFAINQLMMQKLIHRERETCNSYFYFWINSSVL